MNIKQPTERSVWVTSDDKPFKTKRSAEAHETFLAIKEEFKELNPGLTYNVLIPILTRYELVPREKETTE